MDSLIFLQGLLIGFSIAAPVGPIGVLCIRRTLAEGRLAGLLTGLGAATADAFYGCVAGFGLTAISSLLVQQQNWLGLLGGAYLCYLGISTLRRAAGSPIASLIPANGLVAYASTFFLTLTNPTTIFSFIAVFAGLGLAQTGRDYLSAGTLVSGVFLGSALWWLILSGGVSLLRARITPQGLGWINKLAGLVITGFGVVVLVSLL